MAESGSLSQKQIDAIASLASGMSQGATGDSVGVARSTIARWVKIPEFASELEAEKQRREQRAKQQYQQVADEVQDEAIAQIRQEMEEFQRSLLSAYRERIGRGLAIIEKVGRRFDDLPEEAIGVKEMAALLQVGDRLIEKGFEQWADSLAVTELIERFEE
ncbi:MAG: hypothetical protein AAFY26_06100 [Cyanobacteria bacterium J06638_22]